MGSIRRISPLGFRVLVRVEPEDSVSDGGILLPEGTKEKMSEAVLATVIEVASATDQDTFEETNVSGIPMGAMVLIQKDTGVKIPWDDKNRIIESQDVLAIVDEVAIS